MRVLVVGGAGFIGSHVCESLLNRDYEVICLDNLSTGQKSNIFKLLYNPRFQFIPHDITESFSAIKVNAIINCALPDISDTLHYLKMNSYGIFNIAGIARRHDARLVHLSSSMYYGSVVPGTPIKESDFIYNRKSTACTGIQMAEEILSNYPLDVRILRIFDTYGPRLTQKNRFPLSIMSKNLKGMVLKEQMYSICYVGDVVEGIVTALEKDSFKGPINLGNPQLVSLSEILKIIGQYDCFVDYTKVEYGNHIPDITKALEYLNWSVKTDLKTGFKEIFDSKKVFV